MVGCCLKVRPVIPAAAAGHISDALAKTMHTVGASSLTLSRCDLTAISIFSCNFADALARSSAHSFPSCGQPGGLTGLLCSLNVSGRGVLFPNVFRLQAKPRPVMYAVLTWAVNAPAVVRQASCM